MILLGVLVLLVLAVLVQTGTGGKYTDQDGNYVHLTANSSFSHICKHPLWNGNGQNLYSVWGESKVGKITGFLSVRALCFWCGWDADRAIAGTNYLIDRANEGRLEIWNVYPDEAIAEDAHLARVQAVYDPGDPDKPAAVIAAGGLGTGTDAEG